MTSPVQTQQSSFDAVNSVAEAQDLFTHAEQTLNQLGAVLDLETKLTKAGKLHEAFKLQPDKARLTSEYIKSAERYRANITFLKDKVPDATERVAKLHEEFRQIVAINLNAIATARALAESIVQEVLNAKEEHEKPAGYVSNGNVAMTKATQPRPLRVNREI